MHFQGEISGWGSHQTRRIELVVIHSMFFSSAKGAKTFSPLIDYPLCELHFTLQ